MIQDVSWLGRIGASDHETMLVKVQVQTLKRGGPGKVHNFSRADYNAMRGHLALEWGAILGGLCAEDMWVEIKTRLDKAIEEHVPVRRSRSIQKTE